MPKLRYPGKKTRSDSNINTDIYYETIVSFDMIYNNHKIKNIHKPCEQGSLNMDKIQGMINEYNMNPNLLRAKNTIVIGDLNETWYIIDGQHRLEMVKLLYEKNSNIIDELIFCWYRCNTENDMRLLFNSLNHDSTKNKFYIQLNEFEQIKINEFMKKLKLYHNSFAKSKSKIGNILTIEEVRDKLINCNFFRDNNKLNIEELYRLLIKYNDNYYEKNNYQSLLTHNKESFYKPEWSHLENKFIIPLKRNNFFNWINDNSIDTVHILKKGKKRISKRLKDQCWIKEFNNTEKAICPIPNCSIEIIKNSSGWHAGHVISEFNGGVTDISNLRPICEKCNLDMGSMNWNKYIQ